MTKYENIKFFGLCAGVYAMGTLFSFLIISG